MGPNDAASGDLRHRGRGAVGGGSEAANKLERMRSLGKARRRCRAGARPRSRRRSSAASKAKLEASVDSAKQASEKVAAAGQQAREASAAKLGAARRRASPAADAAAAKSAAACGSAGVGKLASATAEAKGRCGEALSAAAMVSGVSVPGRGEGVLQLGFKQRLAGCLACWALGIGCSRSIVRRARCPDKRTGR